MKLIPILSALAFTTPIGFLLADALQHAPAEGSSTKKTFKEATTWELVSFEQKMNGTVVPMQAPESHGRVERTLVAIDTIASIKDGVPLKLEREFATARGSATIDFAMQNLQERAELELASPIDGISVVFERKDVSSDAEAKFESDQSESDASLEGLREDLDLRALIDAEELAEGSRWTIDAAQLTDVLAPGGALQLAPKSIPSSQFLDPSDFVSVTLISIADSAVEVSGEARMTWRETRKQGDAMIAVIEIDWESTAEGDLALELVRRQQSAGKNMTREDIEWLATWTSKGKGELLWDLTAKHARSLELKLDSDVKVVFTWIQEGAEIALDFGVSAQSEISAEYEAK